MFEQIKKIIEDQLNIDDVEITAETSFKEDLGADSLDIFEMVMSFEEEFGLEIPNDDVKDITTVGGVIEYLKSKGIEE